MYVCEYSDWTKEKNAHNKRVLSITKKEHNNAHLRNRHNG